MAIVIVASLVVLQGLLLIEHLALYGVIQMAFGAGGPVLQWFFITFAFTFLSASFLSHYYRGKWIDWYYAAAAYWFGLANFLFAGVVVFFFTANALYAANYYVPPALLAGISFAVLFVVHLYGTLTSARAEITRISVALPHLPARWRGKKIVFVSDLHLGNVRRRAFAEKVVRKINALAPEAVMIGGDLYDGVACDAAALIEPLKALRPPQGTYFVTGNHEYFLPDVAEALAAVRAAGIRILHNEAVDLGGITLAGVDNKDANFGALAGRLVAGRPAVLMKHEPSHLAEARDASVALVLAGHTHRGQIFPLNLLTRQIYRGFDYGLKRLDAMQVYTSSGVGTWGPPLRLGTKSEIVEITFA